MLIIYDETGKIINTETKKGEVQGSLYSIEINIVENKILDKVNTDVLPHVPIFKDKPKTEVELTQEQIQGIIPQLLQMDMLHSNSIKELQNVLKAYEFRIGQLENRGGVK